MVQSLPYKHIHEFGLQNEVTQYHCIIHQRNLYSKTLGFKQIITDAISAVKFLRSHELNDKMFKALLD